MLKNRIFQIFLGAEDGEKIANLLGENNILKCVGGGRRGKIAYLAAALGPLACLAAALGPLACLAAALGPLACLAAALGPLAWLT